MNILILKIIEKIWFPNRAFVYLSINKKIKIVMERDEFTMLVTEFKELVKGTKFEKLIETDLDIQEGNIYFEAVMVIDK